MRADRLHGPVALLSALAVAVGSAPALAEDIVLRSDEWCPMSCRADAKPPGYLVELAQRALSREGHQVRHEVMNWARIRQGAPNTPDNEAVLGIGKNPTMLRSYAFPDIEQGDSPYCFYAYKPIAWRYDGAASLKQVRLGVINGYGYGPTLDAYVLDQANLSRVSAAIGDQAATVSFRKLELDRVDVVLESRLVAHYLHRGRGTDAQLHELGCVPDSESRFYIAFNRRHPKAQAWADVVAAETRRLRANGELARILSAYGLKDWRDGAAR